MQKDSVANSPCLGAACILVHPPCQGYSSTSGPQTSLCLDISAVIDHFCLSWSLKATYQTAEVDLLLLVLSTFLDGLCGFSELRYQEIFPVGGAWSPECH